MNIEVHRKTVFPYTPPMTKPILVCLHGWGGSKESFTELQQALAGHDVEILTPDLPGFGNEPEPPSAWSVDDYARWVETWIEKHAPGSPIQLLGHSHGGRIAIKIATRGKLPLTHLYLCAAAGIRHPRRFRRTLGYVLAKIGRFLLSPFGNASASRGKKFLYKIFRVHDFEIASPVLRETMINVTGEDLRPILHTITGPPDIFWGTEDSMTPVADATIMHEAIVGSTLHVYPGVRHRVHRDRAKEIADIIIERSRIA